jgi:hypothetical protein
MIGKKIFNKTTNEEFEVSFVEDIANATIVYTTDGRSFSINDVSITPWQSIIDEFGEDEVRNALRQAFKPIPQDEFDRLINKKKLEKVKTFKIFGWTFSISKSK